MWKSLCTGEPQEPQDPREPRPQAGSPGLGLQSPCPAWPRLPSWPVGVQRGPSPDVLVLVAAVCDGLTGDVPLSWGRSAHTHIFLVALQRLRCVLRCSFGYLFRDVREVAFTKGSDIEKLLWAAGHQSLCSWQNQGVRFVLLWLSRTSRYLSRPLLHRAITCAAVTAVAIPLVVAAMTKMTIVPRVAVTVACAGAAVIPISLWR